MLFRSDENQIIRETNPKLITKLVNEIDLYQEVTGNVFFRHIENEEAKSLFLYGNFFTIDVSAYNKLNQNNQTESYSAVFAVLNEKGCNQTTNLYNLKIVGSQKIVSAPDLEYQIVAIYSSNAHVNLSNLVIEKFSKVAIYQGSVPTFEDLSTSSIYSDELANEISILE